MNLKEYQKTARTTAIYPDKFKILYPALGIVGECGEVVEKIKKMIRDSDNTLDDTVKNEIAKELGDCCWYLANICYDADYDLDMIYDMKCASIVHHIRSLDMPRLVLYMNRKASLVSHVLEEWYYNHGIDGPKPRSSLDIPHCLTYIIVCIEEIAKICDFTLEEIFDKNIAKLLQRHANNSLHGSGNDR